MSRQLGMISFVLAVLVGCAETERAPEPEAGDADAAIETGDAMVVDATTSASRACTQASDCILSNACFDCACGIALVCVPEGQVIPSTGFCSGGAQPTGCDCVDGACAEVRP